MKIALVCFSNLSGAPYIYQYINIIKKCNCDFDIIYWNRHNIDEKIDSVNTICLDDCFLDDDSNKIKKLMKMYSYVKFVKKILSDNSYDRVVIFTSVPAVLMNNYLIKNFKNRYIFDIRDHSYEHIKPYFKIMNKVVSNSAMNVISSEDFKEFLPKSNYVVCHNADLSVKGVNERIKSDNNEINISFIGQVRYANAYYNFLNSIKNNSRIKMNFYGFGLDTEAIQHFCKENHINNVYFYGRYKPSEKEAIIKGTDVIFNIYGTNLHVKYAVSNKYYDSILYKKPLLVNKGTTMAKLSKGIAFEYSENFDVEEFLKWYDNLDCVEFSELCDEKIAMVKNDMKIFAEKVRQFLEDKNEI